MSPFPTVARWKRNALFRVVAVFFGLTGEMIGQEVTIELSNGTLLSARVESVDSGSMAIRAGTGQAVARLDYAQIDSVEWPETPAWIEAEQWFRLGRYQEAVEAFRELAGKRERRETFYPAPGNFATRAQLRLLDCYRLLGDAERVAETLPRLEADKLPASQRNLPIVYRAWADVGSEKWTEVLKATEPNAKQPARVTEEEIELAYLRGIALEESGRPSQAQLAYAAAYTLNAATDRRISEWALRRSIELLERTAAEREEARDARREEAEDRFELRAQVRLYASLFGKGKLWDEAGPLAVAALEEDLGLGDQALGQNARNRVKGQMAESSEGAELIEQVTADHMDKVVPRSEPQPIEGEAGK